MLINILIAGLRLNNSSDVQYDGRSRVLNVLEQLFQVMTLNTENLYLGIS